MKNNNKYLKNFDYFYILLVIIKNLSKNTLKKYYF